MRLTYEAPLDCPTRPQFEAQVSQRVSFPWQALDDGAARPLRVAIIRGTTDWQANLTYREDDGHELTRSVTASTCEASVTAIAFATALLVEVLVEQDTTRPPENRDVTALGAPDPQQRPSGTPPIVPATTHARQWSKVAQESSNPRASRDTPGTASNNPRPDVSVGVTAVSGVSASPAYGVTILAGIGIASMLPRFGFAAYQSGTAASDLPGVGIRARVLMAMLEQCPASLELSANVGVPLCMSVSSGVLVTSSRIDPAAGAISRTASDFWLMAGFSPKLRLKWGRIFAQLSPDFVVPVTRREFVVTSESGGRLRAYRTPPVALGIQFGLGAQF